MRLALLAALASGCGAGPITHLVSGRVVRAEIPCLKDAPQPSYDNESSLAPASGEKFVVRRAERDDPEEPFEPVGPVVTSFQSEQDGFFSVDLKEGTYCVSRVRDPSRCWRVWKIPDPEARGGRVMQVEEDCPGAGSPGS